ncbi:PREDICTED: uncharacterized protein LOC104594093 [Nelumbo nucifera]|uniref:Uncharacterized protein LOC104594093 n=2 Tax=Nelumbo nucifera TaxID=4432 RepID=A0A1U7ZLD5_NELNU|nr:PREDICTED: uncharacterized protein LOC104594093 [Nelumbo nucifera]DAD23477.1 TPA_asm: hypothetical protein HUJ06_024940 [Nelumbo nucifera]
MESPRFEPETQTPTPHPILSPSSSGRRSSASNSPEFEFWMVRNPSFPQPNLLSADELFVDGVLLPLHLLSTYHSDPTDSESKANPETPDPQTEPKPESEPEPEPGPRPESSAALPESAPSVVSTSKRWRDIFRKGEKKAAGAATSTTTNSHEDKEKDRDKEKKKERKSSSGASAAELNINIWPFSRSRSAGNSGNRPKMAANGAATRKVSSAPCSRSNSTGESKFRKWPSSPGRGGVHLGRSSPVWQVRRGGTGARSSEPLLRNADKGSKKEGSETRRSKNVVGGGIGGRSGGGGARARVLNLNVPMCIGYRSQMSCRSDENSGGGGEQSNGGGPGNGGNGGNLFSLRSLFSKKVY